MTSDDQTQTKSWGPVSLFLFATLGLLMLGVVIILGILYYPLRPHFPPESPEVMTKRLSQGNGFYALEQSAQRVPVSGKDRFYLYWIAIYGFPPEPEKREELIAYLDASYGIAWDLYERYTGRAQPLSSDQWRDFKKQLFVEISDSDLQEWREELIEEVLSFSERVDGSIQLAREGLKAEYYLVPDPVQTRKMRDCETPWTLTAGLFAVRAKWYETQKQYDQAMAHYLDILHLGNMVGGEAPPHNATIGSRITHIGLEGLNNSIQEYSDSELLRQALNNLKETARREAPPSKIFEYEVRGADENLLRERGPYWRKGPWDRLKGIPFLDRVGAGMAKLKDRYDVIRYKPMVEEYLDQLLISMDMPLLEFDQRRPVPPVNPYTNLYKFPSRTDWVRQSIAWRRGHFHGTILSVALRLYRVEHGSYPETLTALVPDYLEVLPTDPFSGQSFLYSRVGDDFRLYGVGYDKDDDEGAKGLRWIVFDKFESRDADQIIHLPRIERLALGARDLVDLYVPFEPYFPPENPEITAKRISPENAFHDFEAANRMMNSVALPRASDFGFEVRYIAIDHKGVDSIDWQKIWKGGWPTDFQSQQTLLKLIEGTKPALGMMRKGLAKEYFLLDGEYFDSSQFWILAHTLAAQSKWYEEKEQFGYAMNNYLDVVRLGMMMSSDGTSRRAAMGVSKIGLRALERSLEGYRDPNILRNALSTLVDIDENEPPLSNNVEAELRMKESIFQHLLESEPAKFMFWPVPDNPFSKVPYIEGLAPDLRFRVEQIEIKDMLYEYFERYLEMYDRPFYKYEDIGYLPPYCPDYSEVTGITPGPPKAAAQHRAHLRRTIISMAVRLYFLEHGKYPDTLDRLVPEYLDRVPVDPFTGKTFYYKKTWSKFRLHSPGLGEDY